jgi:apolipoprotein N-acyltransferase
MPASPATRYAQVRLASRHGRLDRPLAKFGLLPLALAIPAFRLHQHIAYGSAFGELYSFGLKAWLSTFALWWAAWAIGVVLCATALRAAIEAGTLAGVWLAPQRAVVARRALERLGLAVLYLGMPAWLLLRIVAP